SARRRVALGAARLPPASSRPFSPPRFFSSASPTPGLYTLSLHDALPISLKSSISPVATATRLSNTATPVWLRRASSQYRVAVRRSEEHTSELQSRENLVCRLLLEKKKETRQRGDSMRRGGAPRTHRRRPP